MVLSHLGTRLRVLVPVLMGQMARSAISVGDALAGSPGGSGAVLALVEIRAGRDHQVFAQDQRRRDMLRWVAGLEYRGDVRRRLAVTLRLAANLASSVRDAIAETEVTTLVLEWPTVTSPRRHGLTGLTRQLVPDGTTDMLLVRSNPLAPDQSVAPRSILAPIRGGPSARTVASIAGTLADAYGSTLTLLHVRTGSQHPDRLRREWETFEQIVEELHRPSTRVRLHRHDDPGAGILEEATGHDLLVIGSRLDPVTPGALIGRGLQRIVRQLAMPVIMVRPKRSAQPQPSRPLMANGDGA